MRVLLVIESAGGGSGRHVLDLAAGLADAGHEVALVYSPVRAERWFVAEAGELQGVSILQMEIHRAPSVGDLIAAARLRRLMARCGPFDVVHGHGTKAGAIVRLAGFMSRSVRIYTPHAFFTLDPTLGRAARLFYTVAERMLALLGRAIICVSEEERDHAIRLGIAPRRLTVVTNGLAPLPDADREAVRRLWKLDAETVCVGFVGRISAQKAVHRLVECFAAVLDRGIDARLVIVGTGPLLESVREVAQRYRISEEVIFHGAGPGPRLMAGFDVFAMTSRYEAFPYVYLEALYRGLPIVTSEVGGSSAVIREGINGFVVEQHDRERFVELLAGLCADPERRAELGRQSRAMAPDFSVETMVASTLAVYHRVLAGGTPGP